MLKRIISVLLTILMLSCFSVTSFCLEGADLSAVSAVLYSPESEKVLFEKNSDRQLSMASTTKIMTSLIALEENTPEREILLTAEMVNVEGTSAGLRAGDTITLENLVKCMMLESGNDAANAVAIALGGSHEGFAVMMNDRASAIGMKNTSFVTPSGLDAEEHYTTAYDMALLTAEALENKVFETISCKKSDTVSFIGSDKTVKLYNHNKLLGSYEGCIGVKTGFTKKSGRCLVSAARRNGVLLVAVTLNAGDDWNDHKKMLDYGFSVFSEHKADIDFSKHSVRVTGGDKLSVVPVCEEYVFSIPEADYKELSRKVYLDKFLYAPVRKGDIIGFAEYYNGEKMIKTVPLTASEDVDAVIEDTEDNIFDRFRNLFDSWWKKWLIIK